jgi:hypothetical protein
MLVADALGDTTQITPVTPVNDVLGFSDKSSIRSC